MHEASQTSVDRFVEALWLEDGLSANTLAAYRRDLSLLATWLFLTHRLALDAAQAEMLMRRLAADPNVEYVEVDQIMRPTLVPNDARLGEQWGFGTSNASINVRPAWDKSTGTGVVVAVIDTGITQGNPDLQNNVIPGYDMITDKRVSRRDSDGRAAGGWDLGDWMERRFAL